MKEIRMAGKLECNFNDELQKHMENVGNKLNDLVDAIKLARNDGYNLTVDISKLEKEEEKEMKNLGQPMNKAQLYLVEEACKDPIVMEVISLLKQKEGLTYAGANEILLNVSTVLEYEATYLSKLPLQKEQ